LFFNIFSTNIDTLQAFVPSAFAPIAKKSIQIKTLIANYLCGREQAKEKAG